jgi:hypothetical protein
MAHQAHTLPILIIMLAEQTMIKQLSRAFMLLISTVALAGCVEDEMHTGGYYSSQGDNQGYYSETTGYNRDYNHNRSGAEAMPRGGDPTFPDQNRSGYYSSGTSDQNRSGYSSSGSNDRNRSGGYSSSGSNDRNRSGYSSSGSKGQNKSGYYSSGTKDQNKSGYSSSGTSENGRAAPSHNDHTSSDDNGYYSNPSN